MRMLLNLLIPATLAMSSLTSPAVLAQDCPTTPIESVACPASPGNSETVNVHIRFGRHGQPETGSTELTINPPMRQMVRALDQTRLTFTLQSIGGDTAFDEKNVTIDGGPCHLWLSGSGTVNSTSATNPIEICLPSAIAALDATYYYTITVDDVGILDPHVRVEP
jgi:hypothetical protein